MGDSQAADGEKRSPEKHPERRAGEHFSESEKHIAEDKHHEKAASSLYEAVSKELDHANPQLFKRITGSIIKGILDLETGTEDLLKSAFSHDKHERHHNRDAADAKAADPRDRSAADARTGAERGVDTTAKNAAPQKDAEVRVEQPAASDVSASQPKVVKSFTVKATPAQVEALKNASMLSPAPDAAATTFTKQDTANTTAEIKPVITTVKTKAVEPEAITQPKVGQPEAPAAETPLVPRVVKTVSITGPAPDYSVQQGFQPASSFQAGPDATRFTLPGDTKSDTTQPAQAPEPKITILKVHTVDPAVALSSPNVLSNDQPARQVVNESDCTPAGGTLKPLRLTDVQAAVYGNNETKPVTGDPQTNPASQDMNRILFDPTPIAQQRVELTSTPAETLKPITLSDVHAAVYGNQDPNARVISEQPAQANDREASNRDAYNRVLFDPTPIAQQRVELTSTPVTPTRDTSNDDSRCTVAGPLKPFTLADIHNAVYGNDNPTTRPPGSTDQPVPPTGAQPNANPLLNPTPLAEQRVPLGDMTGKPDSRLASIEAARSSEGGEGQGRSSGGARESGGRGELARGEGSPRTAEEGSRQSGRGGDDVSRTTARGVDSGDSRTGGRSGSEADSTRGSSHSSGDSESSRRSGGRSGDSDISSRVSNPIPANSDLHQTSRSQAGDTPISRTLPEPASSTPARAEQARNTSPEANQYLQKPAADLPKTPLEPAAKKLTDLDQPPPRYAAVAPQTVEAQKHAAEPTTLASLANTLARIAQPTSGIMPLDSFPGKSTQPSSSDRDAAAAKSGRAEAITGPVALSTLTGRTAGDGILVNPTTNPGRTISGAEAAAINPALSNQAGNAALAGALAGKAPGAAVADVAAANAVIANRGIFAAGDALSAAGKAGAISSAIDASAGRTNNPVFTPGAVQIGNIAALQPASIRTAGQVSTFTDAEGRTVRIDANTGRIQMVADGTRTESTLSLSEMVRIRKVLGERRYLTGVEVAIACAIASTAIAKARNNQTATEGDAAEGSLNFSEAVDQSGNSTVPQSGTPNLYKRPTYTVAHNDSLVDIAEKLFHDSDVAWLIADINAGRISEHVEDGRRVVELRSRQEIELPLPSEVREFLLARPKEIKADNLVTIVTVTEVDRELLDSFLSTVVGGETAAVAQKPSAAMDIAPAPTPVPQPLMQLVDFGKSLGKSLMPSMNAIITKGLNLRTYISRIDVVPSHPALKPEPQR